MIETVSLKITIESLTDAISSLDLKQKHRLLDILEQKIFEEEEALYEDDAETLAEIASTKAEYEAGEYVTLDEYKISSLM